MKIDIITSSYPDLILSNNDIISLIKQQTTNFKGDLDKTLTIISRLLKITGSENRRWLEDKKPFYYIIKAIEEALDKTNLLADDIDLLMYVGIGKGFAEPAQSYFVAQKMGMNNVKCLDITDACMSWASAMQIANSLLKTGVYKKIMLVNGEFITRDSGLFKTFNLKNRYQIEYTLPVFTLGNAATCTILSNSDNDFDCQFLSNNTLADLCILPTSDYHNYSDYYRTFNGANKFTSYGAEMHRDGAEELIKLFNSIPKEKIDKVDIVFTHASSKTMWHNYAKQVGIENKIYDIYKDYGNLVSASVPFAMVQAEKEGKLKRGDNVMFWLGTAGMCFNATFFKYE